jgi:chromosome partitioning protein
MAVVAVVNRKGGSGKSTVAVHIASWCARQGHTVMLADSDPQQSSRSWLRRRGDELPRIAPLTLDTKSMLRVPSGFDHAVLDTPGGLRGFELARILMFADAIVMPVCNSVFDRESAGACLGELMKLPRVAGGRCQLATMGMRIDGRTNGASALREWALGLGLDEGLAVFDLPPEEVQDDVAQWDLLLNWLTPLLQPLHAANDAANGRRLERVVHAGRAAVLAGGAGQRLMRRRV